MVEKDSNTGLISADVIPTITSDKLPNNVVTLNSNNKIDDNKLSENIVTMTTLNGYATTSQLEAFNDKLPTMDASTGAMTWTDPNGNSVSYGGYTFWVLNTYNKKISGSWFQCTTWTTDAPTSSWILQNEIQGLQCHSSGGWTYGTNCILDGTIETYNVPPAKFKYNLCKTLQSGDITALIDEQVTAKGYATTDQLADKLNTSDLATKLAETANANAVKNIISADTTVAKTSDLSGYAALSSGKISADVLPDNTVIDADYVALKTNAVKTTDTEYGNIKTLAEGALQKNKLSEELQNANVVTLNANNKIDDSQLSSNVVTTSNIASNLPDSVLTTTNIGKTISDNLPSNVVTTDNIANNLPSTVVTTTSLGSCTGAAENMECTGLLGDVLNAAKAQTGKTSD